MVTRHQIIRRTTDHRKLLSLQLPLTHHKCQDCVGLSVHMPLQHRAFKVSPCVIFLPSVGHSWRMAGSCGDERQCHGYTQHRRNHFCVAEELADLVGFLFYSHKATQLEMIIVFRLNSSIDFILDWCFDWFADVLCCLVFSCLEEVCKFKLQLTGM